MPNTFYVRTWDKKQYVEAKILTDIQGNPIISSNPVQSSFNLFDADHNPIGTNTSGYLIVPADFDIKTAVDFGRSVSSWKTIPAVGDVRFANAFYPGIGWLDIQTHYNGTSRAVSGAADLLSALSALNGRCGDVAAVRRDCTKNPENIGKK